jgi:hypothetical protein
MAFTQNPSAVKSFGGGWIKETNFYALTIEKAFEHVGTGPNGPSKNLYIQYVTDTGQSGDTYICYETGAGLAVDKNGNPLSGLRDINDLMVICDIKSLAHKPGMVGIRDKVLKAEVQQKRNVYADLVGRHIGAIISMELSPKYVPGENGQPGYNHPTEKVRRSSVKGWCSDTGQTAKEVRDGEEPVATAKYVALLLASQALEDAHIIKQAGNAANAPVGDTVGFTQKPTDAWEDDPDAPF